jgi:hypothetical protein
VSQPDLGRRRCLGLLAAAGPMSLALALAAGCEVPPSDAAGPGTPGGRAASPAAGPATSPAVRRPPAQAGPPMAWLLTRQALALVAANRAVQAGLQRAQVFELLQPGQQPRATAGAIPVVGFPSAALLQAAVRGNQLPAGTDAVLYDPEVWSFTPGGEQRDPVAAARRAAAAAHSGGLRLIVAPALNLTTLLAPGSALPRWRQFLDLRLAGRLAAVADVIELQAQSLERDVLAYADFVTAAAAQARAANPRVTLLAGLSTNPPGEVVSSQQLVAAIRATQGVVDGYWLNIPGQGRRCPACRQTQLQVGIDALAQVL